MSLFGQGVDARICSVTMATAFENVNLHVQITVQITVHHFATISLALRSSLYCCVFHVNGKQIYTFP